MANALSFIVRGLGAGMKAYGEGVEKVAERDNRQREADALLARQIALDNNRSVNNRAEADYSGGITRRNMTHQGEVNVGVESARSDIAVSQEERIAPIRVQSAVTVARAQNELEQANLRLTSQLRLNEAGAAAAQEIARDAAARGGEIGNTIERADGSVVFVAKDGRTILGQLPPGSVTVDIGGTAADPRLTATGGGMQQYRRGGGGTPAASPSTERRYNPATGRIE